MTRITLPQLDVNLIDVTLTQWRKKIGDPITTGEIIADITTDKAVYELEATASGTLLEIYAQEKSIIPTGYILGLIGQPGDTDPAIMAANEAIMQAYRPPLPTTGSAPTRSRTITRVRATPRVRRLAQEKGIDLAAVQAATQCEVIDETIFNTWLAQNHPQP